VKTIRSPRSEVERKGNHTLTCVMLGSDMGHEGDRSGQKEIEETSEGLVNCHMTTNRA